MVQKEDQIAELRIPRHSREEREHSVPRSDIAVVPEAEALSVTVPPPAARDAGPDADVATHLGAGMDDVGINPSDLRSQILEQAHTDGPFHESAGDHPVLHERLAGIPRWEIVDLTCGLEAGDGAEADLVQVDYALRLVYQAPLPSVEIGLIVLGLTTAQPLVEVVARAIAILVDDLLRLGAVFSRREPLVLGREQLLRMRHEAVRHVLGNTPGGGVQYVCFQIAEIDEGENFPHALDHDVGRLPSNLDVARDIGVDRALRPLGEVDQLLHYACSLRVL